MRDAIGLPSQPFLIDPGQALGSVLVVLVWKDIGLTVLAGLQSIPSDYYEAANLDGAGPVARFRFITLPLLSRLLLLAVFMATIAACRVFTPILLMTEGGPQDSSVDLIYLAYEQAFKFQRL